MILSFLIIHSVVNLNMLRAPTLKLPVQSQNYDDFDLNTANVITSSLKTRSSLSIQKKEKQHDIKNKNKIPPNKSIEKKLASVALAYSFLKVT